MLCYRVATASGVAESAPSSQEESQEDTKCTLSDISAGPSDSSATFRMDELHPQSEYAVVRAVLYSTRENVNIVHECFRRVNMFILFCIIDPHQQATAALYHKSIFAINIATGAIFT